MHFSQAQKSTSNDKIHRNNLQEIKNVITSRVKMEECENKIYNDNKENVICLYTLYNKIEILPN